MKMRNCLLGDIITFQRGYDLPKTKMKPGKIPVVGSNGIIGYHDTATTEAPCITIGRSGNVGTPKILFERAWAHNTTLYIKEFKNTDPFFVFYLLTTLKLNEYAGGSAVPTLNRNHIHSLAITIPDELVTQKQIGQCLRLFDSKIEQNAQINRNLEQQAQAIFKSWFVDFAPFRDGKFMDSELGPIPAGWRVGTLEDIADITMGQSPKGESYNENSVGTVFYQGRAEFTDRFPVRRLFTTEPKRMATSGDVLLSVRAPVGDMNIANEPCCIGRGLATIHAKHGFTSFVFYTMQTLRQELDKYNGEGTVFGCINKDSLNALKVIIPPENIISVFEERTSPLDRKYFVGIEENMRLTKLRDTLLQKLMSGEIDVSEVEV